jgi:serine protease AprX
VSENGSSDFSVYPNPANDLINISFSDKFNGQVNLSITDLAGREIYSEAFSDVNPGQLKSISSTDFEEGMYLLHLQSGENRSTRKIVLSH